MIENVLRGWCLQYISCIWIASLISLKSTQTIGYCIKVIINQKARYVIVKTFLLFDTFVYKMNILFLYRHGWLNIISLIVSELRNFPSINIFNDFNEIIFTLDNVS